MVGSTFLGGSGTTTGIDFEAGSVWISAAEMAAAVGWELKPEGLCRDDVCVPVRDRQSIASPEGRVDLTAVAPMIGTRLVADADRGVAAMSVEEAARRRTVEGAEAVEFSLPDLAGTRRSSAEWGGTKRLYVCWASW